MADKLNGQGLPVRYAEPYLKNYISKQTALRDTLVDDSEDWSTY